MRKSDVILSLERSAIYRGQAFLAKNPKEFYEILRQSFPPDFALQNRGGTIGSE
ncbi:MAG: hypothetical protein ORN98_00435 [Alphaproteobacteria bacterium]|nr:hypothetical protein [Alphaproteobacteria bacterium]